MAKKKQSRRDPSDSVQCQHRTVNAGVVGISVNSYTADSNYYVDRERLQDDLEYDAAKGKFVETKTNILRNVKRNMGGLRFPSSNKRSET